MSHMFSKWTEAEQPSSLQYVPLPQHTVCFYCLSPTTFPFSFSHKNIIVLLEQLWGKSGNYEEADGKMSSITLPPRVGSY